MTANDYILQVVAQKSIPTGPGSISHGLASQIVPYIEQWAANNGYPLPTVWFSGSYVKGTAVAGSSDLDLFISLDPNVQDTLRRCFDGLFSYFRLLNIPARKQNVSVGITYDGYSIDLTPGKKLPGNTSDHNLYKNKTGAWTKTNIDQHINIVANSGRLNEIKAIKIWRNIHGLEFPSTYLELTVIKALSGKLRSTLAENVLFMFEHLARNFTSSSVVDPANAMNVISDDLTQREKHTIAFVASNSLTKPTWEEILW